jgi:hypothetical protein
MHAYFVLCNITNSGIRLFWVINLRRTFLSSTVFHDLKEQCHGGWDETFRCKDSSILRFRLKMGCFKATAPGVWHPYCTSRCKIRFWDPADFATTRIPIRIRGWNLSLNCHSSFKDPDLTKKKTWILPSWPGFRFITLFGPISAVSQSSLFLHCGNQKLFYDELPSSWNDSFQKMR